MIVSKTTATTSRSGGAHRPDRLRFDLRTACYRSSGRRWHPRLGSRDKAGRGWVLRHERQSACYTDLRARFGWARYRDRRSRCHLSSRPARDHPRRRHRHLEARDLCRRRTYSSRRGVSTRGCARRGDGVRDRSVLSQLWAPGGPIVSCSAVGSGVLGSQEQRNRTTVIDLACGEGKLGCGGHERRRGARCSGRGQCWCEASVPSLARDRAARGRGGADRGRGRGGPLRLAQATRVAGRALKPRDGSGGTERA
jgi:hypothetical protein